MKEAPGSSKTSILTRATRRNNPEDTILQYTSLLLAEAASELIPKGNNTGRSALLNANAENSKELAPLASCFGTP
jgi:hypothetical protein